MAKTVDRERVRVVLVRPRNSGNVGACARAMKNMGLRRLALVAPRRFEPERAAEMAVHAGDVLESKESYDDLRSAIAGCGLAVGTTCRPSAFVRGALSPRSAAPEILAATVANDVALVFGPENNGLATDELALCQRLISIPASGDYGSLNLAQAVLIVGYELFVFGDATRPGRCPRPLATGTRLELMYARFEEGLRAVGFLHGGNAAHMMRSVRGTLARADLDDDDVRMFLGIARQMSWAAARGRGQARPPDSGAGSAAPEVLGVAPQAASVTPESTRG